MTALLLALLHAPLAGLPDADGDGFAEDVDCDEADPTVHPDAVERVADGIDQDCDGQELCYADADADGYGSPYAVRHDPDLACGSALSSANSMDCDDSRGSLGRASFPGNPEVCDGIDNDCNGRIDEDPTDAPLWYADADLDGAGDPSTALRACEAPQGWTPTAGDCDDESPVTFAGAPEICDQRDNNCNGQIDEVVTPDHITWLSDVDGDGLGDGFERRLACVQPRGFVRAEPPFDACPQDPDPECGSGCTTAPGASASWLLLLLLSARRRHHSHLSGSSTSQDSGRT